MKLLSFLLSSLTIPAAHAALLSVGPDYRRPAVPLPTSYRDVEATASSLL